MAIAAPRIVPPTGNDGVVVGPAVAGSSFSGLITDASHAEQTRAYAAAYAQPDYLHFCRDVNPWSGAMSPSGDLAPQVAGG